MSPPFRLEVFFRTKMNLFAIYVYKIGVLLSLLQGQTWSGAGWPGKVILLLVKA